MTDTPTIDIDMDKPCSACGEMGVTKSGLCIKCVTASLSAFKGRGAIGFLTLTSAKTEICALIDDAAKEIDEAYIKADGDLTVDLKLKLTGTKMAGEIKVVTSINFVESRFKRANEVMVNEKQMDLPGMKAERTYVVK